MQIVPPEHAKVAPRTALQASTGIRRYVVELLMDVKVAVTTVTTALVTLLEDVFNVKHITLKTILLKPVHHTSVPLSLILVPAVEFL